MQPLPSYFELLLQNVMQQSKPAYTILYYTGKHNATFKQAAKVINNGRIEFSSTW